MVARQGRKLEGGFRQLCQGFAFRSLGGPVHRFASLQPLQPLVHRLADLRRPHRAPASQSQLAEGQVNGRSGQRKDEHNRQPRQRDPHGTAAHDDPHRQAKADQQIHRKEDFTEPMYHGITCRRLKLFACEDRGRKRRPQAAMQQPRCNRRCPRGHAGRPDATITWGRRTTRPSVATGLCRGFVDKAGDKVAILRAVELWRIRFTAWATPRREKARRGTRLARPVGQRG